MHDIRNISKLITNGILEYLFTHKANNITINYSIEDNILYLTSEANMIRKPNDLEKFNKMINKKVDTEIDLYYSELLNSSDNKMIDFNLISSIVDAGKFEYDQENKKLYIELIRSF